MPDAIGRCCVDALLTEVGATPKPGLVDLDNSGAHADMDWRLFRRSVRAIAPYLTRLAAAGTAYRGPPAGLLPALRLIGREGEREMFAATGGVNTHKGALFSLGLVAAAAGRIFARGRRMDCETLCATVARIVRPCAGELHTATGSHGLAVFRATGIAGARGEALSGFASVRRHALPVFRRHAGGAPAERVVLQALLQLMANVDDSNVIHRGGLPALRHMQRSARACLRRGGALAPNGRAALAAMNVDFTARRISPGGCADLLAVAVALLNLERMRQGAPPYGIGIAPD
ncbi:MAG: triphosphoribosyl-dephospho-CoA synthase, partial [Planctomycetes bacterium]|nr:triphosphoribosyl-dephospho-CoA synthase [Planctomycetota bacterium]